MSEWMQKKDQIIAILGLIFFLSLVVIIRLGGGKENLNQNPEEKQETPSPTEEVTDKETAKDSFWSLTNNNYHFTYTIKINEQTEIIEGKVYNQKSKFSIIGTLKEEFAEVAGTYLKLENNSYQVLPSLPRTYFSYIKTEEIQKISNKSIAKKEENKEIYTIDPTDLIDEYTNLEYDGFEKFKDDSIIITKSKDENIEKIELDYSSYFSFINNQPTTFQVTMNFDGFGTIEDFEI